jgi:hypothetical protein
MPANQVALCKRNPIENTDIISLTTHDQMEEGLGVA